MQFEELFLDLRPELFSRALLFCRGDMEAAEDLVQDCALRAFDCFESYDPEQPFAPWIHRILIHAHIEAVRKQRLQIPTISLSAVDEDDLPFDPGLLGEGAFELFDAIFRMRADYAAVLVGLAIGDHDKSGTGRSRRSKARAALCRVLGRC